MIIKPDKEKILKEFKEKYFNPLDIAEYKKIIIVYSSKNNIKENLISDFNAICKQAVSLQKKKSKGDIKYIYFSMLRTQIIKNSGKWRIDLYDKNWFLDKEECSSYLNFDFVYEELFKNIEELSKKKKEYGRVIKESDICDIKLAEADKYQLIVQRILEDILPNLLDCESFKEMKKDEDVVIALGEYRDAAIQIYP